MARMTVADWFAAEDLDAMRTAWQQALTGGSVIAELPIRMKDGSRVPYLLTGVRVVIDGRPHLVGIGIDIAQRKAVEAEAARQRAELAHLSRVASLSELSGSLAHELNQPLAIILSNAQAAQRLLAKQPPDLAEVRDILADIVAEDRRAGDVIKRLRAFLKHGEPERHPLSLNEVVGNVLALVRSELLGREIELDLDLAQNLPRISGDRIPLEQVVLNLVTNACDAMADVPAAQRRLSISTGRDGADVRMSVRDAGSGLPPQPGRVFDPFYTTKPNGLGMGLTICLTIVTAHGGRLWAESNPGPGATFHVALPAGEPTG
jgi:C4-dicarboxylate-specific signal transduction histidine kinase